MQTNEEEQNNRIEIDETKERHEKYYKSLHIYFHINFFLFFILFI